MQDKVLLIWLLGTGAAWLAWTGAMLFFRKWLSLIAACIGTGFGLAFGFAEVAAMNLSRGDAYAVVPRVVWLGTVVGLLISEGIFLASLCARRPGREGP